MHHIIWASTCIVVSINTIWLYSDCHHQFLWAAWVTRILLQINDELSWLYEWLSDPHITTISAHHQPSKIEENTDSVINTLVRSWSSKNKGMERSGQWQATYTPRYFKPSGLCSLPEAYHLRDMHLVSHTNKRSSCDNGIFVPYFEMYQPLVKGNEDVRYEGAPERRCSRSDISLVTLGSLGAMGARQKLQSSMWWDSFGRQILPSKLIMAKS